MSFIKVYRFTLLVALIIFILSAIPGNAMPSFSFKSGDKVGHFLAYGCLCFVMAVEHARKLHWSIKYGRWLIPVTLISVAYGMILEVMQGLFFYHRTFDYADMLANTLGSLLGIVLYFILFKPISSMKRFH